ncbi:hypothetical protein PENSPDRAFT_693607 [Peniophora sp. CONT]|nr:hypothetical protein PENSPDRAFT_693607 [Peniophora sp. CONT]
MSNDLAIAAIAAAEPEIAPGAPAIPQVALVDTNPGDMLHGTARAINNLLVGVNEAVRGIAARLIDVNWSPERESAASVYAGVAAVVDRQMRDNGVYHHRSLREAIIRNFVDLLGDTPVEDAPVVATDALVPMNVMDDIVLAIVPVSIERSERVGQPSSHVLTLRTRASNNVLGYDASMVDTVGDTVPAVDLPEKSLDKHDELKRLYRKRLSVLRELDNDLAAFSWELGDLEEIQKDVEARYTKANKYHDLLVSNRYRRLVPEARLGSFPDLDELSIAFCGIDERIADARSIAQFREIDLARIYELVELAEVRLRRGWDTREAIADELEEMRRIITDEEAEVLHRL